MKGSWRGCIDRSRGPDPGRPAGRSTDEAFLDLTVQPVRSRTETRFRCREPGAASFADLAAGSVLGAVLNGRRLDPPVTGRLALPGLGADNVLTAEAEVAWSRSG